MPGKFPDGIRPMTEQEIEDEARSDPDAQPLTEEDLRRMRRVPRVKVIRRALHLTQEEFAARYRIPIGTLRDSGSSREAGRRPHRAGPAGARLSQDHRARSGRRVEDAERAAAQHTGGETRRAACRASRGSRRAVM